MVGRPGRDRLTAGAISGASLRSRSSGILSVATTYASGALLTRALGCLLLAPANPRFDRRYTLPNFVYRPSLSLRRNISSTPHSARGSRLVVLVSWPGTFLGGGVAPD
ncbi:MAG TPA: hypothetical protein VGR30_02850 [Candidatus Binatia bacterium]|nr:hypothetical protein [Candidatus Binatia bacterium]